MILYSKDPGLDPPILRMVAAAFLLSVACVCGATLVDVDVPIREYNISIPVLEYEQCPPRWPLSTSTDTTDTSTTPPDSPTTPPDTTTGPDDSGSTTTYASSTKHMSSSSPASTLRITETEATSASSASSAISTTTDIRSTVSTDQETTTARLTESSTDMTESSTTSETLSSPVSSMETWDTSETVEETENETTAQPTKTWTWKFSGKPSTEAASTKSSTPFTSTTKEQTSYVTSETTVVSPTTAVTSSKTMKPATSTAATNGTTESTETSSSSSPTTSSALAGTTTASGTTSSASTSSSQSTVAPSTTTMSTSSSSAPSTSTEKVTTLTTTAPSSSTSTAQTISSSSGTSSTGTSDVTGTVMTTSTSSRTTSAPSTETSASTSSSEMPSASTISWRMTPQTSVDPTTSTATVSVSSDLSASSTETTGTSSTMSSTTVTTVKPTTQGLTESVETTMTTVTQRTTTVPTTSTVSTTITEKQSSSVATTSEEASSTVEATESTSTASTAKEKPSSTVETTSGGMSTTGTTESTSTVRTSESTTTGTAPMTTVRTSETSTLASITSSAEPTMLTDEGTTETVMVTSTMIEPSIPISVETTENVSTTTSDEGTTSEASTKAESSEGTTTLTSMETRTAGTTVVPTILVTTASGTTTEISTMTSLELTEPTVEGTTWSTTSLDDLTDPTTEAVSSTDQITTTEGVSSTDQMTSTEGVSSTDQKTSTERKATVLTTTGTTESTNETTTERETPGATKKRTTTEEQTTNGPTSIAGMTEVKSTEDETTTVKATTPLKTASTSKTTEMESTSRTTEKTTTVTETMKTTERSSSTKKPLTSRKTVEPTTQKRTSSATRGISRTKTTEARTIDGKTKEPSTMETVGEKTEWTEWTTMKTTTAGMTTAGASTAETTTEDTTVAGTTETVGVEVDITTVISSTVPPTTTFDPECLLECPPGWIVGKDQCYYHVKEKRYAFRQANAMAFCWSLGSYVGMAGISDFQTDYKVMMEYSEQNNITNTLYHLPAEIYHLDKNGTLSSEMWDLSRVFAMYSISVPAEGPVEGGQALCKRGKFCAPMECYMKDVYEKLPHMLPTPMPIEKLPYGEKFPLRCLEPSKTVLNVACNARGQISPKLYKLKCEYPLGLQPEVEYPRNGKIRRNCGECSWYGTDECMDVEGGVVCKCQNPFLGFTCRKFTSQCEVKEGEEMRCQNGGTCITIGNRYKCECPKPFYGDHCQLEGMINWANGNEQVSIFTPPMMSSLLMFLGQVGVAAINLYYNNQPQRHKPNPGDPQSAFVYTRNLLIMLASLTQFLFGRPGWLVQTVFHCKVTFHFVAFLVLWALLNMWVESHNITLIAEGKTRTIWGQDAHTFKNFWLSAWWRLLWPFFVSFSHMLYTMWHTFDAYWSHTCLGNFTIELFELVLTHHLPFVAAAFGAFVWAQQRRESLQNGPEHDVHALHQVDTQNIQFRADLLQTMRNRWFQNFMAPTYYLAYTFTAVAFDSTGTETEATWNMLCIVASATWVVLNICQAVAINDHALEHVMICFSSWTPWFPWPTLTPVRNLNKDEIQQLLSKDPIEGPYNPKMAGFLSAEERSRHFRIYTIRYLMSRCKGVDRKTCIARAMMKESEYARGKDPQAVVLREVRKEWKRNIKEWDKYILLENIDGTESRLEEETRTLNRPRFTPIQRTNEEKIRKHLRQLIAALWHRPVYPDRYVELYVVCEDYGLGELGIRHWKKFKTTFPAFRLASQLEECKKAFEPVREFYEDHVKKDPESTPSRFYIETKERILGNTGVLLDATKLPGGDPFVEIYFMDTMMREQQWKYFREEHERGKKEEVDNLMSDEERADRAKVRAEQKAREDQMRAEANARGEYPPDEELQLLYLYNDAPEGFGDKPVGFVKTTMRQMMKSFWKQKEEFRKRKNNWQRGNKWM